MKILTYFILTFVLASGIFAGDFNPFIYDEYKTLNQPVYVKNSVDEAFILTMDRNVINSIVLSKLPSIKVKVPVSSSASVDLILNRFDIFEPYTKIVKGTEYGDVESDITQRVVCYTGYVSGDPGSVVSITFGEGFVSGMVFGTSTTYVISNLDVKSDGTEVVVYNTSRMKIHNHFECGSEAMEIPQRVKEMMMNLNPYSYLMSSDIRRANIAVESCYDTYLFFNQNYNRAASFLISLMSTVSAVYIKDMNIQLLVTYLRIWTTSADPYNGTTSNALLNEFRSYWNANMQHIPRTIAHFIATRPGGLGGVAWLNVLCSSLSSGFGYAFSDIDGTFNNLPTYSWDVMVVAHETGHNFGSPHTHNCGWPGGPIDSCYAVEGGCYNGPIIPRTGTIMSYCHLTSGGIALNFGPLPSQLIRANAESAVCMSNVSGILVAKPNGGEIYRSSNNLFIVWGTSMSSGNVNIELSTNNGSTWTTIQNSVPALNRTFNWTVPLMPTADQCRVRISETGNPGNNDISDSVFQIRPNLNSFNMVYPPQLSSIPVYSGDTTKLHFTWTKAGTLPEIKYKWTLMNFTMTLSYTEWSNNSGQDSVFSISLGRLDSIALAWGTTGDSIRCRWSVKAYTIYDSASAQSSSFLITFKRSVIGIQPISDIIPDEFFLNQNYPNPFNPNTKIKFGLPKSSVVKITVYDILGKEISILVNQELKAGVFETEWDASVYPSGIYFCRMEAGEFSKTFKMIIAK